MQRLKHAPRADWQAQVENLGLSFHTIDGETYWDESAHYRFNSVQISRVEEATRELQRLCVEGAEKAIRENWRQRLFIPEAAWEAIIASWERDDLSLYGRFDLMWDGTGNPKLLEYNADTPTGLLEASVAQWQWLEQCYPQDDQFNSIHEGLLASWAAWPQQRVHFTAQLGVEEDWRTLLYLMDTCKQAGKETHELAVENVGWNEARKQFVDEQEKEIELLFKLYPWEWMWKEAFSRHVHLRCERFLEPVWKMLWSNKAFMVLLWKEFPSHPNLLRADFDATMVGDAYAEKAIFGREGANVRLVERGSVLHANDGPWGDQPVIYQQLHPEVVFDGQHPVIGSWIIGGEPAGVGIREDRSRITANGSRFVPHRF
jgi:glutathionylspermidine synthase